MKTVTLFCAFTGVLLFFAGCSKKPAAGNENVAPAVSNVSEVTAVEPRQDKAPNFSWQDTDGKRIDFSSLGDKITLVNFWATWCGPCKHEMPDLIALSKEYQNRGVRIIGISADVGTDVIGDVKSFVQEEHIPYQILVANDELKEAFGNVNMLPTSFVVDKEGKILETLIGARSKAQFAEILDKHL